MPQTLHKDVQYPCDGFTVFLLYSFSIRCLCNVFMGGGVGWGGVGAVGMKTKILLKQFSCNMSRSDLRSLRH